jgi:hypothetical protein
MKDSLRPRKTAILSEPVSHHLNMYALAASAAGMGILALAQPAEAKIVYTPADKWLPVNKNFYIDLNHDGVNDFRFSLAYAKWSSTFSRGSLRSLAVEVGESNQLKNAFVYSVSQNDLCAPALPKGTKVGPKSPFTGPAGPWLFLKSYQSGEHHSACRWLGVKKQAYLGLRFTIKGLVHYGWARLGYISTDQRPKAKLTGYAYETIPNKPIVTGRTKDSEDIEAASASLTTPTPQSATLGALAVGASGLSIWRREEPVGNRSQAN